MVSHLESASSKSVRCASLIAATGAVSGTLCVLPRFVNASLLGRPPFQFSLVDQEILDPLVLAERPLFALMNPATFRRNNSMCRGSLFSDTSANDRFHQSRPVVVSKK